MRIKKVFELFDTDDLKSENEIAYLTGNFKDLINNVTRMVKKGEEKIGWLVSKIASYHFPFMGAFIDNIKAPINFNNFKIRSCEDETNGYYVFIIQSDESLVALGVRINSMNDYDVYVVSYDGDDDGEGMEYKNLDYSELLNIVQEVYIPVILGNDFGDILEYQKELSVNN